MIDRLVYRGKGVAARDAYLLNWPGQAGRFRPAARVAPPGPPEAPQPDYVQHPEVAPPEVPGEARPLPVQPPEEGVFLLHFA